jgi:hypothetical protein
MALEPDFATQPQRLVVVRLGRQNVINDARGAVDIAEIGSLAHLLDVSPGEQVLIVHIAGACQLFIRGNAPVGGWSCDAVIECGAFGQNRGAPQHQQCKNTHTC